MSFFDELGGEDASARRERAGAGVAWGTIIGVALLIAAVYIALASSADDTAPRRASVAGVDIGGLSATDAEARLRGQLQPRLAVPVELAYAGEEVAIVPEEAGLSIDWDATLRAAGVGGGWNPLELWAHYTDRRDTDPVLDVDPAASSRVLDTVTARFDTLAEEGTLDFSSGKAVAVYGKPGLRVDREATMTVLQQAVFDPGERDLPVEIRDPYISGPAVREALETFGKPAMSAPVAILVGPERIVVPPKVVGQALTMIPSSGKLEPRLDSQRLLEVLEPRLVTVGTKPRNAAVRVVDGTLEIVPARIGAAWDDAELERGLLAALVKPEGERRFRLQAAITEPEVDDATVAGWGVAEQLASITVQLDEADEQTVVALGKLDNHRIPAGESLSLLDTITPEGVGDQARTLGAALFTTAFRTGLAIDEYTAPTSRDFRFPAGMDIAFDADHDLVVRNPTPWSVLVSARVVDSGLEVSLWSTAHFDTRITTSAPGNLVPATVRRDTSADCVPVRGRAGFSIAVARKATAPDGIVTSDRLSARYPPRDGVTC